MRIVRVKPAEPEVRVWKVELRMNRSRAVDRLRSRLTAPLVDCALWTLGRLAGHWDEA